MPTPDPWITRDMFARGHFEFGSGTSLQPLLRFSDRVDEFMFVDVELELDDVVPHLEAGFKAMSAERGTPDGHCPLELESLTRLEDLAFADFELVTGPEATFRDVRRRLTDAGFGMEEYFDYFKRSLQGSGVRQWGLEARVVRRIRHTDGEVEVRPLTLRIVGGEGLLVYLGMGGAQRPPVSLGTVQTGWGELRDGPVAGVLQGQARSGAPLPRIWIRGSYLAARGAARAPRVAPAEPFPVLGQSFAHWVSDRVWPGAPGTEREVRAWIREMPALQPMEVGAHRIVAAPLTAETLAAPGSACLPRHLTETLGVSGAGNVHVVQPAVSMLMRPLAVTLTEWEQTRSFNEAAQAVFVPFGYEDELSVLVRWLKRVKGPAITVHLPMPLDFEAATRAVSLSP